MDKAQEIVELPLLDICGKACHKYRAYFVRIVAGGWCVAISWSRCISCCWGRSIACMTKKGDVLCALMHAQIRVCCVNVILTRAAYISKKSTVEHACQVHPCIRQHYKLRG